MTIRNIRQREVTDVSKKEGSTGNSLKATKSQACESNVEAFS